MSPAQTSAGKLSTIDLVFSIMDSPRRPLDFTLLFHLKEGPGLEALRSGAKSARNLYPTTGSYIDKKQWIRFTEPKNEVISAEVPSLKDATMAIEEFLERPFDPRMQAPVQQLLISHLRATEVILVTRFHHAVADGVSAAMWLGHQLRVANGKEPPIAQPVVFQNLTIRTHQSPVRRSHFAFRGPSHRLWAHGKHPTRSRRWHTIEFAAADLRKQCREAGGFTYNDLLATCTLEVFKRWNDLHSAGRGQRIGVWLPVNIRRQSSVGFGNGTGRIRLYARYPKQTSIVDKCREVRRQVSWSTQHGEWAVPSEPPLTRLPLWAVAPALRAYLNRPWVDMATGVFSHVERVAEGDGEVFKDLRRIESIGQLHTRYSLAVNAATHSGKTWLTFTYDPGLLSLNEIERLVGMYQEEIDLARRQL